MLNCHLVNQCTKFDVASFSRSRDIVVLVIVSRLFLVFLSAFILLVCVLSRLIYNKMMMMMMMMD